MEQCVFVCVTKWVMEMNQKNKNKRIHDYYYSFCEQPLKKCMKTCVQCLLLYLYRDLSSIYAYVNTNSQQLIDLLLQTMRETKSPIQLAMFLKNCSKCKSCLPIKQTGVVLFCNNNVKMIWHVQHLKRNKQFKCLNESDHEFKMYFSKYLVQCVTLWNSNFKFKSNNRFPQHM